MPLSACLADRSVMSAWPGSEGEATHTSTFLGHPLACATAIAALETLKPAARAEQVAERGAHLMRQLRRRLSSAPGVGDIRGAGLLVGIELVESDSTAPAEGAAAQVAATALQRGLLVLPAGEVSQVVELTPAVVVTDEQIDFAVDVLLAALEGAE